jgi:hypothetical protein
MVEHHQAFALVGPLEHSQVLLDRHQGGPITAVGGLRLGESGKQTVAQIRRRDWWGWVQGGAV